MTSEIRANSITSRAGLSTVTMTDSGPMFSGITTFVDNSGFTFGVGGGTSIFTPATNVLTFGTNNTEKIRIDASGHMHGVGVITATHFYGDGSNLTGISAGTALSGSTNNTLVTVTGANAITGESTLTYDGSSTLELQPASATPAVFVGDSNRTGANQGLVHYKGNWNGTTVARITIDTGDDTTNKDDGIIRFDTAPSGSLAERLRITKEGYLYIRDNGVTQTNTTLSYQSEGAFLTHYTARTTAGGDKYRRMFDIASVGANPWGSSIRFLTSADSTNPAVTVERVRIDHNGRVGINKSTPQTMLSIKAERSAVPRFGIDGHYSDSSYTQSTWDDSSGLYTLLGVNHQLDANGNDATPVSSLHSSSIFLDGRSGNIRFFVKPNTGTSFTEVARITDNGRFGIGTGSPDHKFEVEDNNSSVAVSRNGANAQLLFKSNSVAQAAMFQVSESSGGAYLQMYTKDTSGNLDECIRVDPDQRVMMGSISSPPNSSVLTLRGETTHLTCQSIHTGGYYSIYFRSANTNVGNIFFNSGGVQFNTSSDYRRKENVVSLTGAIDRVKTLLPKRFNFISEPSVIRDGFLAHEVTAVPEAITGVKDAVEPNDDDDRGVKKGDPIYQCIDQSKLVPLLTASIQELITKVETLEQDNIALRARVTNLEDN